MKKEVTVGIYTWFWGVSQENPVPGMSSQERQAENRKVARQAGRWWEGMSGRSTILWDLPQRTEKENLGRIPGVRLG